ncbi:hypothetical protein [Oceanisphaera ostreae]|uniref:Uncharacterized protein n=1 Tax=Oceanisphaera ostreae TaxID=914151 RepID=A0ABW3KIM3_9GAMM
MKGVENVILVEGAGKLRNCKISIKGNNTITIKDGANVSYSQLNIAGDHCDITTGENTDIGGAIFHQKVITQHSALEVTACYQEI